MRAQQIDPLSKIINVTVGMVHYFAGDYDLAIAQYQKTLDANPDFEKASFFLGWVYEQKGLKKEAVSALKKAVALSGESTAMISELGCTLAGVGNKRGATKILNQLLQPDNVENISSYVMYSIAATYAALGENDKAITWLEKTFIERSYRMTYIKVDPKFKNLRADPRFLELQKRVGLIGQTAQAM